MTEKENVIIVKDRRLRDPFFLVLFVLYWAGMIFIATLAISKGNIYRLKYGVDSDGHICGTINTYYKYNDAGEIVDTKIVDLTPYQYLYYFNPKSPKTTYRRCVSECPKKDNEYVCKYGVSSPSPFIIPSGLFSKDCIRSYSSQNVLHRCVPLFKDILAGSGWIKMGAFESITKEEIQRSLFQEMNEHELLDHISDNVYENWMWIIWACGIAMGLSLLWLFLIPYISALIVWITVYGSGVVSIGACLYLWNLYVTTIQDENSPILESLSAYHINEDCLLGMAILSTIFLIFVLAFASFCRKRISLAITIIDESSNVIKHVPSAFIIPIVKYILVMALFVFCLFVLLILGSCEDEMKRSIVRASAQYLPPNISVPPERCRKHTYILIVTLEAVFVLLSFRVLKYFIIYYIFGLLWSWNVVLAVGECIAAGAFSIWYWSSQRDKGWRLPFGIILTSTYRTIRYSLGSLALGSLLVAVVQLIRIVLEFMKRRIERSENRLAIFVMTTLSVCFYVIEKFVIYMNSKAYVYIAIYGCSFFKAVEGAGSLIGRNSFRAFALGSISKVILFLAKVSITLITVVISAQTIVEKSATGALYYYSLAFIMLVSYVIASVFVSVMEMAIDTIFICFLEDCERNDGSSSKPYRMPDGLRKFVEKKN